MKFSITIVALMAVASVKVRTFKFRIALAKIIWKFFKAITEEQKLKAQSYIQQCKAEEGIDSEQAKLLRAGNFDIDSRKAQVFITISQYFKYLISEFLCFKF